jgi:hypothetical protein
MWKHNKSILSTGGRLWAALIAAMAVIAVVGYSMASSLGTVIVDSKPAGAKVVVQGRVVGSTPARLQLPADQKVRIKLQKPGYKDKVFTVVPSTEKARRARVTLKKK